jgi:hypothetical protein
MLCSESCRMKRLFGCSVVEIVMSALGFELRLRNFPCRNEVLILPTYLVRK